MDKRIYIDNAGTTKTAPEVIETITEALENDLGERLDDQLLRASG